MKGLGWKGHIPSIHDFSVRKLFRGVERPKVKELWFPPVKDQGDIGSCGPHAACTLMESVMVQNIMEDWVTLSPMALYYFVRERCGEVSVDTGVDNRTMLQVMVDVGVPENSLWIDDTTLWNVAPPPAVRENAGKHQVLKYHYIEGLLEIIQTMAEGYAILGGMPVYESFRNVGASGLVPMPGAQETGDHYLGGHDLYYCGYDDHRKVLYGQNSWGTSWGKEGRFYLPYEYADRMLSGCYTITLQEG